MAKKVDLDDLMEEVGIGKMTDIPIRGWLSTGSLALDWAIRCKLSGGGYPQGRIVEIYGDPSTGKSLMLTHAIANAQKLGWYVFLDDAENALDKFFAQKVGANPEELFYANSETIEGHFKRVSYFVRKIREKDMETPILVCLDSLAMLSTTHEKGCAEVVKNVSDEDDLMPVLEMEKRDMTKAQLVRAGLRVLATRFMKDNVLYICSNHATAMIGVSYGPKTTTPGGGGIKFAASVRIDLNKGKTYSNDEGATGHEVSASVTKNKVAPPFKNVKFNMFFDRGVEPTSGVLDILQRMDLAVEGGGWWRVPTVYGDKKFRSTELEQLIPEIISKVDDGGVSSEEPVEAASEKE